MNFLAVCMQKTVGSEKNYRKTFHGVWVCIQETGGRIMAPAAGCALPVLCPRVRDDVPDAHRTGCVAASTPNRRST